MTDPRCQSQVVFRGRGVLGGRGVLKKRHVTCDRADLMEFQLKHKDDLPITHIANKQNLDCATFSHSAALGQHLSRGLLPPTVASVGRRTLVRSPSAHFVLFSYRSEPDAASNLQ